MTDFAQRIASLTPAQRQLLDRRLQKVQRPTAEPIAIIGMACRFPGAPTLDAYWQLIQTGETAAREVPPDRWNVDDFYDPTGETAGKMSVRWAALVDAPDQFDPQFFGITPREAARMDPQQRFLLEVAWEAMENAGRPADQLAGTRTGVFIGIGGTDYSKVCVPYDDYFQHIDAHMGTGNALSIAANRLSYIFDFHGPSAAVDTACSSSSLAIHFAVESLRRGESDAALAGGVNMILTPETTIAFSKARMLSPDGKCRPFDAAANGYVRGEGCGLVFLKRLADAQRDGDNILAVVRATSVNQDGRTSGISAPNSQSQTACIRAALQQAGLNPEQIGYVEAHGTGTPLGDPIEMQSLCGIFRDDNGHAPPCYVASVKANVGHMETVSGAAGLIKVVLMMQHGQIVRQANFESLNSHIDLSGTRLVIPTTSVEWPSGRRPRLAGISSFGFGGTNTHLIVEAAGGEPPAATGPMNQRPGTNAVAHTETVAERPLHVLKLSGKSHAAVTAQAAQLAEYLAARPDANLPDVAWSWNTGRADFNYRAVIATADAEQLRQQLEQLAAGTAALLPGVKSGTIRTLGRPKVAFLFTGQGAQYAGMGRGLFESQPVFRRAMAQCDEILRRQWGRQSLIDILYGSDAGRDDANALVHQTAYTQPALFALEYALAELWRSWGVVPDIVLGHSVGEYAAACIAGVMPVDDGLGLLAERARLMQSVRRPGKMAVVFAPHERVARELSRAAGDVVVAVINGPENTVVSGEAAAVDRVAELLAADGVQVKPLHVSHAFHSPLMDEMLDEFERYAARIDYAAPTIPLAANLTGQLMLQAPTARYWRDHLRNTVQFAAGMARIAEAQPTLLVELGPTASLLGMGRRCVPDLEAAWLPSLRQGADDWQVLAASLAECYVRGSKIDWRGWDAPWTRRRRQLPNYPFQRSRHWYTLEPARRRLFADEKGAAAAAGLAAGATSVHPLIGARLSTVLSHTLFETRLSGRAPAYLSDHCVQGSPVTPAAAYIEQGLAAAEQVFGAGRHGIADIVIQQAMFLPEGSRRRVQVSLTPESGGVSTFEIYSQTLDADSKATEWTMHATGSLVHESQLAADHNTDFGKSDFSAADGEPIPEPSPAEKGQRESGPHVHAAARSHRTQADWDQLLQSVRDRAVTTTSRDEFYRIMADRGLAYGPAFQVLDDLQRSGHEAVARVKLPESIVRDTNRYHLHPALGDALLQSMAGAVPLEKDGTFSPHTYMPVGIRRVRIVAALDDVTRPMYTYVVRTSRDGSPSPERVEGDVFLVDEAGGVLVALEGVQAQRLGRAGTAEAAGEADSSRWLYRVVWQESPLDTTVTTGSGASGRNVPTATPGGAWLILADSRGIGLRLADRLAEAGQTSILAEPADQFAWSPKDAGNGKPGRRMKATLDPLDEDHYRQLLEQAFIAPRRGCLGIVHLWSLDIPAADCHFAAQVTANDPLTVARRLGCGSAVQLFRAVARTVFDVPPPTWFVTAGGQLVDQGEVPYRQPVAAEQAPMWGLVRVAALELSDFRPRLVDLDPNRTDDWYSSSSQSLAAELRSQTAENQVAYRSGKRLVARLVRDPALLPVSPGEASQNLSVPAGRPYQLRITQAGSLDALRLVPVDRETPAAGQVEIEVHAAGLNFSDVLKALGLYPGIKDAIVPLGIEASGVVTAVGPGVDRFRVGDEVFGVVPYAFASHARTAEYALVHKPPSIAHDQACTIPITFLTAYYGLVHLAQLQPGERVLIHAGAGGVGLAAIQIAQHIGAELFVTAGSESKRDFVRSLGVQHVYSSRSVAFAEEILADTERQGVDVVLNSLPGEAITKSLALLRAYGRFLEIGKTDIYQNRMIGLLPFQDNLSYFAIDLDRMLRQRPEYIRTLFSEVMGHFMAGHYRPLMYTRFPTEATIDAFRYMSQRKNIGKVVVSVEGGYGERDRPRRDAPAQGGVVRRDGTYLVTGGLGAIGLHVADWLATQGAGVIALLARRAPSAEAQASLARLRERAARVVVLTGDVADAHSLSTALAALPADAPPMRGVLHAAGVLADGILNDMTLDQLDQAMAPKVHGAWNLHTATLGQPLDFFVLFSSVASVLGSPGQANYAAGNAYLDALAAARRAQGLPATALDWGPWAGSGMAAEAGRDQAVRSRGMALLDPASAIGVLGRLLNAEASQVAVMDARWDEMLQLLGARAPTLLAELAAETRPGAGAKPDSRADRPFRERLQRADDETRHGLVREYIRDALARIMGVEPASLDLDQPLATFGLDSLLALELKNNLESRLEFTLPMAKLMEGPSIASLAAVTVQLVTASAPDTPGSQGTEQWVPLLALREAGHRPPLILLPALGGDIRCYAELVEQLDEDQPVYAFRPRGVDQDLPPHLSLTEMMADYLTALRGVQPRGPYHLAGWSTGGVFAFALAEALERADEKVAFVALFDTPLPSICHDVDVADDARFLCDMINFANRFAGTNVQLEYQAMAALSPDERFRHAVAEARRHGIVPRETPEAYIRRLVGVGEANVRVIQQYRPQRLSATVHLFVPLKKGGLAEVSGRTMPEDEDHGWSREIGQTFDLHTVPGDHFTMMLGGGATQLARQVAELIDTRSASAPRDRTAARR